MTQLVKTLLCKCEDPVSLLRIWFEAKLSVEAHIWISRAGKVEAGRSLNLSSQPA